MTREKYDKTIATGELQLTGFWEKSTHYGTAMFLLFVAAVGFFLLSLLYFQGSRPSSLVPALWVVVFPLAFGFFVLWIQKNRLKFTIVKTTLTEAQIKDIIERVALDLKWKGRFTLHYVYEATTSPGFFSGSWGEQITILLADKQVLVNSICDPKKKSSMVSMGRNRKNEQTLIDRINAAQQDATASSA